MLSIALSAGGILLHAWLVIILWRGQLRKQFPLFFTYNIYALLATAGRLAVSSDSHLYFYTFWWTDTGFLLLGIASLHEGFRSVFEGFYLLRWFRWLYFGAIVIAVGISTAHTIFNPPIQVHPFFGVVLKLETPIQCIQAAIFGLFYICAKLLNVSFRRYPFAIVLGFGISAIGTLIPFAIRSIIGKSSDNFVVYAPSVAYYITLGIWLSAFLQREPADDEPASPLSPEQMTHEVRQYTRVMKGVFGKSNES